MKMKIILSIIVVFSGVLYFFIFTPWGVHTWGETIFSGDKNKAYLPDNYPSNIDDYKKTSQTITLPQEVKQPSGIDYDSEKDAFFVVTDQAEIIELSANMKEVNSHKIMSNKPLLFRQGSVESNDFYQDKLFVGGDKAVIEIWEKQSQKWIKSGQIKSYKNNKTDLEAEALAINPANGHIYLGKDHSITVIDQNGDWISEFDLELTLKNNRSNSEYIIAGMDFYNGTLYVLTEYHSAILSIDPKTETVDSILALEGIIEGAGLTVRAHDFVVVVDHELNENSPGVKIYNR